MHRLICPLLFSLILHALVASQIVDFVFSTPISNQRPLTVSFVTTPKSPQVKIHLTNIHPSSGKADQSSVNEPEIAIAKSGLSNEASEHLDITHLLNQASEYAKKEYKTSDSAINMYGDFSGTFSGKVNGSFFFHLDANGHIIGSGQSDTGDLIFNIKGKMASNGTFSATGFNINGTGGLMGILDSKTGKISGTWSANIWSGFFSGRHE